MRSVFVIVASKDEKQVIDFLDVYCDQLLMRGASKQWNVLKDGDRLFYIYQIASNELLAEMEDKTFFDRLENMNRQTSAWQIDISGRHDGTLEIKKLLKSLFEKIDGFAVDDYTDYFWAPEEIEYSKLVAGHTFFDCAGWWEEYNNIRK